MTWNHRTWSSWEQFACGGGLRREPSDSMGERPFRFRDCPAMMLIVVDVQSRASILLHDGNGAASSISAVWMHIPPSLYPSQYDTTKAADFLFHFIGSYCVTPSWPLRPVVWPSSARLDNDGTECIEFDTPADLLGHTSVLLKLIRRMDEGGGDAECPNEIRKCNIEVDFFRLRSMIGAQFTPLKSLFLWRKAIARPPPPLAKSNGAKSTCTGLQMASLIAPFLAILTLDYLRVKQIFAPSVSLRVTHDSTEEHSATFASSKGRSQIAQPISLSPETSAMTVVRQARKKHDRHFTRWRL
ncbi:hypothetical protein CAPTEDRAFT_217923 [Capitella teleta]|uniref:Uncharacterized protein n=1 Tax=Capitella teleta TaxID=283909 RepID=R7V374_CAPTE|nr:hypothetical protein CAPTEDRAFT_217923 [Capitella teleta]|eukprot:ELU13293.1 hypothetical protein CAPTEDRAFT_217923 [Capitella teleta]